MEKKETNKQVRLNLYMSSELSNKLTNYCDSVGLTKSTVVQIALSDFLKQRELVENVVPMLIEQFKQHPEMLKVLKEM